MIQWNFNTRTELIVHIINDLHPEIVSLFSNGWETDNDTQCQKSREKTKVIIVILDIESFEQQCFFLKGFLQSDQLKQHMVTIESYQTWSKCVMYKHMCLENIKKLYTSTGKCNNKLQFKAIVFLTSTKCLTFCTLLLPKSRCLWKMFPWVTHKELNSVWADRRRFFIFINFLVVKLCRRSKVRWFTR